MIIYSLDFLFFLCSTVNPYSIWQKNMSDKKTDTRGGTRITPNSVA